MKRHARRTMQKARREDGLLIFTQLHKTPNHGVNYKLSSQNAGKHQSSSHGDGADCDAGLDYLKSRAKQPHTHGD